MKAENPYDPPRADAPRASSERAVIRLAVSTLVALGFFSLGTAVVCLYLAQSDGYSAFADEFLRDAKITTFLAPITLVIAWLIKRHYSLPWKNILQDSAIALPAVASGLLFAAWMYDLAIAALKTASP
jgi:type IV secretory pathway VirB6-like protein